MLPTVVATDTILAAHIQNTKTAVTNVNNALATTETNATTALTRGNMTLYIDALLNNGSAIHPGSLFGTITDSTATSFFLWDGAAYTDETTDFNDAGASDFNLMNASTPAVDDATYFGHTEKFSYIKVDVDTVGVGTWTIVWEYWNGSAWATLTIGHQGMTNFRDVNTDIKYNVFEPPSDWATTSVNSQTAYWIRARVSAFTSMSTTPVGGQGWIGALNAGSGIVIPTARTLSAVSFAAQTAGTEATNDNKILFINKTAGTFTTATYTKLTKIVRSNVTDLSFAANDELVIQQVIDQNASAIDVNLILEFS